MRYSPDDRGLNRVIRELAQQNLRDQTEKVVFLGPDNEVRDVLYAKDVESGAHLVVRARMIEAGELKAVVHLNIDQMGEYLMESMVEFIGESRPYGLASWQLQQRWLKPPVPNQERWEEIWRGGPE